MFRKLLRKQIVTILSTVFNNIKQDLTIYGILFCNNNCICQNQCSLVKKILSNKTICKLTFNLIIMVSQMYKSIIIIVLCFANYQAQYNNCTELITEQLFEQCSLAKNVSLFEIHWCLQLKYQKAVSLVYYYTTKKNWIEAFKAHCQSLQDTKACLSIIQVGYDS